MAKVRFGGEIDRFWGFLWVWNCDFRVGSVWEGQFWGSFEELGEGKWEIFVWFLEYEVEKLQIEVKLAQREVKHKENQRVKEVALLEQKIELQKHEISELKDQQKTQKDLYDTLMRSIKATNVPSNTEQKYLSKIKSLEEKHERRILETIGHYTQKCEKLYSYIKESEKLQDDLESQRKQEKRELLISHESEIENLHEKYN